MSLLDSPTHAAIRWLRPVGVTSASLLLGYGLLRLLDRLDGHSDKGAWA
ncbi:hypothetical protein [Micromonospora sp. WMMD980]|nr:hypothetical protein [Micromonospora sp. WMMD980]MDG4802696.1 hypothetical protein [Micromonospora sp. WMMD980]